MTEEQLDKVVNRLEDNIEILDHRLVLLEKLCNRIARFFLEKAMHEMIAEEQSRHKSLRSRGGGGFNIVDDGKGGLRAE